MEYKRVWLLIITMDEVDSIIRSCFVPIDNIKVQDTVTVKSDKTAWYLWHILNDNFMLIIDSLAVGKQIMSTKDMKLVSH